MNKIVSDWEFNREVKKRAEKVGVEVKKIRLRSMKRKGRITFDKCLLEMPIKRRSEVIIHELLHLKYPNHGRMFKALMKTYISKIK